MGKNPSERRVVMARRLAKRFLEDASSPEYRLRVYYYGTPRQKRAYPNLLRSFRDGKLRLGGMDAIPDLGVHEEFDHFEVWSADRDALKKLAEWFEDNNFETSGIW